MKKYLILAVSFLMAFSAFAQDGKKALKQASKDLGKYYSDPANNKDKLTEAIGLLDEAFQSDEVKSDPESYIVKGKIYNEISASEIRNILLNPAEKLNTPNAAVEAYEALATAMQMATKKGQTKDALAALAETEGNLNNIGITMFQEQNYGAAFDNFNAAIEAYKLLKNSGKDSRLDDEATRNEHYFYTVAAGYYGDRKEKTMPLLKEMESTTDKPLVYEALFNYTLDSDKPAAEKYLVMGREKFPNDTGLLFAEINYYLKEGRLEELTGKLKMAIEKEPDNPSVYVTLGNVYDQLSQAEAKNGNTEKSAEYFDSAMQYYNETLAKDPNNFDAEYSIGAMYYNKAAAMTEEINQYANDFSKAGTQKYNEAKAKMDGYFDQAMPYFLKAESIDANDQNTLIALKEIYARKNQMDKVKEYQTKLDATNE
ncbi:MAG TPA: hypothetical protein PK147_06745 [Saprospiraceae bacterium]|nr:hypothetical protein [Lewinellaceae bacterium]HPQ21531.1 hypothetical protein [Saprospiraceae bacterium]